MSERSHTLLKEAFARDAQAMVLCGYFAEIARIEGFSALAGTLQDLAELLRVETGGHLDFLVQTGDPLGGGTVGTSADNGAAVRAWLEAAGGSLPEMALTARAEGVLDLASWFDTLLRARTEQLERLQRALASEVA
jgi:rubrerythrin